MEMCFPDDPWGVWEFTYTWAKIGNLGKVEQWKPSLIEQFSPPAVGYGSESEIGYSTSPLALPCPSHTTETERYC